MANERITESVPRKHFERYLSDVKIEEQSSKNPRIDKLLKKASKSGDGKGYPDFIISFENEIDLIAVIECKPDIRRHESHDKKQYKDYAVDGALLYASHLSTQFDVLAIAVSGDGKNLKISHYFQFKNTFSPKQVFGDKLLPPSDYVNGYLNDEQKFRQDYDALYAFAKELNERLHSNKVSETNRSLLISAILIALDKKSFKKSYPHEDSIDLPKRLVDSVSEQLRGAGIDDNRLKVLTQKFSFITTEQALTSKEGELAKIVKQVDDEINSFIQTHKYRDVLSDLYVEFLKYTNSDKGLGIVLTPPHITELFVDLAQVNHETVVYDNCVGTGGFLIAAMKRMIESANGDRTIEKRIKKSQLYGVELQSSIYPLAVSNMYINQDGKSNVLLGDCFDNKVINKITMKKPTVGLLNPPYKADKKKDKEELEFVLNNLNRLQQNGICIAILPMQSALSTKGNVVTLKEKIMASHTLEAVLSMPDELFFNSKVGVVTCVMIFTAHHPHPNKKLTYFGYYKDDGFLKRKAKGRADYLNKWNEIKDAWVSHYMNGIEQTGFSINKCVGPKDEWAVESYMETDYSCLSREMFETTLANYSTYLFQNKIKRSVSDASCNDRERSIETSNWEWVNLSEIFTIKGSKTTSLIELEEIGTGKFPYVTTQATNNGVGGFYDYATEDGEVLTVDSAVVGYCSYQSSRFSASDHVEVLKPKFKINSYVAMFLVTILNLEQYRYNYGRKCSQSRLKKSKIKLPVTDAGEPDIDLMEKYIKSLPYSSNLKSSKE